MQRDLDIQVHEANRSPYDLNVKQPSPRHSIIKLSKIKDRERILEAGKKDCNLQTPIRLSADLSAQNTGQEKVE